LIRTFARFGLPLLLALGFAAPPLLAREDAVLAAPAVTHARPALWRIKDRDTTIYLFGTIHLLKPGIAWFVGGVRKAFDASDALVLEIADQDDPAIQARIAQKALATDGPPLTARMESEDRAKLLALLDQYGLPQTAIDRMKPWFAALTLTAMPLRKLGFDPANGVEETLRHAAAQAGKPISGLETSEEQLGLFDSLPQPLQLALLRETIDEQGKVEETLEAMIGAWSAGDPERLAATLNGEMDQDPELEKRLLLDRNAHWADWIKARLEKPGTVFVAVGAGHLAGKGSVQALLGAMRINARRVKNR
jgi:uncharacterized protein YbaP (TraB family)